MLRNLSKVKIKHKIKMKHKTAYFLPQSRVNLKKNV